MPVAGPHKDPDRIHLLDVDEELADTIPEDEFALARGNITASAHHLPAGAPDIGRCVRPGCVGLLILEGFVTRDVVFAEQPSRELVGPTDILRPWDYEPDFLPPFSRAGFTVLEATLVAHLDLRLLRLGARWPAFVDELMRRALYRSRWLAIQLAIEGVTRVDERLLLFFWQAAGRWGRVTPRGVELPLRLTHATLAELVGAQRPSVTTALNQLEREGRLEFRRYGAGTTQFTLLGEPPGGMELAPSRSPAGGLRSETAGLGRHGLKEEPTAS